MGTKFSPHTKKITLVEIDIGQVQTLFFNWTAGVWYVDFDAVYELIDPIYLFGVYPQPSISKVGSVMENGVQLTSVASVALCITTAFSFFYDLADRRLYIHLTGGAEPSTKTIVMGITTGISNHACYYNSMYYEPRLESAPALSKSKDPLFFGRISFDGGTIGMKNADGAYDAMATSGTLLWGGAVRILQGFDDDAYASFLTLCAGVIDGVSITKMTASVRIVDKRKMLSRKAPRRTFDIGTYPNMDYADLGNAIPLCYGHLKGVPCVCTNKNEVAPAAWAFKICDCTDHAIQSIDAIHVGEMTKTALASSLANGTFTLIGADYTVGDIVKIDMHGYVDGGAVLIENAADIMLDLMLLYLGIPYTNVYFNLVEWAAATALAMNVGIFIKDAVEVFQIIEDLCASTLANMIQQDDGLYTLRIYDPARAISQTFYVDELLDTPSIDCDLSQVLSSTSIGYGRDWSGGSFQRLHDTSQEAAIFAAYNVYREKPFDTLLTNATDAQAFSTAILAVMGKASTKVTVKFKLQPLGRELMDFAMIPVYRQGKAMLGTLKAEIFRINKDPLKAGIELGCRIV